ncbi:MAG TPA: 2'-5' RNA ligase family protein [Aquabacterium sp.]|uniref:2'-5' RNA ligase family protein n=1 Tax=Aquabacterium sp. TaxID=1872578 RepID=UPI002E32E1F7|nr:2'-5' RNA ligase family protein [Aquabacterium sp.]HEX5355327.1 2'-5' RNA ligase family protein [Aquabacterium sp.]
MSSQASFEGFEQPGAPTDRLFFALMPDAQASAQAQSLAQQVGDAQGLKLRANARERFHITLFHLGDFHGLPAQVLERASQAAEQLQVAPFEVRLDRLCSFKGGPRRVPVVLMSSFPQGLIDFHDGLEAQLHRAGLLEPGPKRVFKPHLTLLYGQQAVQEQAVEALSWRAREFVLIRSLIGQGRYIVVNRWPLFDAGRPSASSPAC